MSGGAVLLAGGAVGAGVWLLLRERWPAHPDLLAALSSLDTRRPVTDGTPFGADPGATAPSAGWVDPAGWVSRVAPGLPRRVGVGRHRRDLAVLAESAERLVVRKIGFGLVGLVFPPALVTAMGGLGLPLPRAVPAVASLALAAGMFLLPDVDLRRRAARARADLRRVVAIYLELVALERAADAGAGQAVRRAADIGDGPGFERLRDALTLAELAGDPPWQGLSRLAAQVGVPELGDVADIIRLSGHDGAAVYATLRARAAGLRTQLITEQTAHANAASERMVAPVACLGLAYLALLGYPAFAQLLTGTP